MRLSRHAVAVIAGLAFLPRGAVFQGLLPPLLDRAATALLWLWFVNLFNFMDGIDGITGSRDRCARLGLAAGRGVAGTTGDGSAALALGAAAAALGFLRWNWHPARIFLGDVGSVPLGYLLGWLLLVLAGARAVGAGADPAALLSRRCEPDAGRPRCAAASASGRRIASISISARWAAAAITPRWRASCWRAMRRYRLRAHRRLGPAGARGGVAGRRLPARRDAAPFTVGAAPSDYDRRLRDY